MNRREIKKELRRAWSKKLMVYFRDSIQSCSYTNQFIRACCVISSSTQSSCHLSLHVGVLNIHRWDTGRYPHLWPFEDVVRSLILWERRAHESVTLIARLNRQIPSCFQIHIYSRRPITLPDMARLSTQRHLPVDESREAGYLRQYVV